MSAIEITTILLGALCLLLVAVSIYLYKAKIGADRDHAEAMSGLRANVAEGSKVAGRAEELERTVEVLRQEKRELEEAARRRHEELRRLSDQLATARTEATNARATADELLRREREASEKAQKQHRESADALVKKEKEACLAVLDAKNHELEAKNQEILDLNEFIAKAREQLGADFKALSQETLKDVSEQFEKAAKRVIDQNSETTTHNVKLHQEQIEQMLIPMGLTLASLDQQIKDTNEKRGEAEAVLMHRITEFAGANERLANALSKPVIRGSFAEVKLESLLEAAGLTRGENFALQVTIKDGDQTRIVDALVDMAQGKKLVIDSKNLLLPYVEYANASVDDRPARLAEFQRAFRNTLRALSVKDYSKHWDGIDAVIMFLPDEGMYMAAIEADRQLIATMYEQRVFAVSPVSLLPILKSVGYVLGLERRNRETEQICEAGNALYEALGVILGKIQVLGEKLDDGVEAYNGVVASFQGNVLPKTRTLRRLGIQQGKKHAELIPIEPQRREFRERTVIELAAPSESLTLMQPESAEV